MGQSLDPPEHEVAVDRGNTFLEILISVALMGTIVVALLLAMQTSITLSRISNDQAKVESVLGSAADRVANFAYSPCPGADGAEYLDIARAAAPAVGWTGAVVTIDEVTYWHPATPTDPQQWKTTNSLSPTECLPSVSMTDQRTLQKVRIRVTSPGGDYSRTIDVVKANFRPDEIRDQT
jgi:Flp pilus assembly protein TadG